jgi:hypothetical protein
MHHARLTKSDRLKRVLKLLKTGKTMTTLQIIKRARVCAVSAIVSELRANGFTILCWRSGDKWFYQLAK